MDARSRVKTEANGEEGHKESQAAALLRLGLTIELFHDPDGLAWACAAGRTLPCSPLGLGAWLRRAYYQESQAGVSEAAVTQALQTLQAIALNDRPEEPVFVRLGASPDGFQVVLDMADSEGNCVVVRPGGWRKQKSSPVRLWHPPGMRPLPLPMHAAEKRLGPLWELTTFEEEDQVLVAAWLLMCLNPWGPYPGLFLHGEQGSAKSMTAWMLRCLVDPNRCPLRQPPRDEDALAIAARNGLVVALDNLSHIDQTLSDNLCRLLTGGGISKRRLFTDSDEVLLDIKRPVLVTGIPDLATGGDLADRVLTLTLPGIGEEGRLRERDIKKRFELVRPLLLGTLLDGCSLALRDHEAVKPASLPRMADFACWACAGLPALGYTATEFLDAYRRNRESQATVVLDSSAVVRALEILMQGRNAWEGTAAEMLEALKRADPDVGKDRTWPRTARGLSGVLRRLAPSLRRSGGYEVEFARVGHGRQRTIYLSRLQPVPEQPSASAATASPDGIGDETPFQ